MELIPILSLIILVATICTFILAVGAYILYKIRERQGRVAEAPQETVQAELITPTPAYLHEQEVSRPELRKTYYEEQYNASQYDREQGRKSFYKPIVEREMQGPELKPTYGRISDINFRESEIDEQKRPTEKSRMTSDMFASRKKFMRYTKDGYIEPTEEKEDQQDRLKWR